MKRKNLSLFVFFLSIQSIFSQDFDLSILTLPDSLRQNANAIVRYYDTNIELVSHKKMIINTAKAITILNKKGDHNSKIIEYYSKSSKVKKLKILVYNQFGKKIKEIKSKEIKDYSAADGFSLFNDNRLKYYKHIPTSYPYTIVYKSEVETSNTAFIPKWIPIDSYYQGVQKSSFTFSYPSTIAIQKHEKNFSAYSIQKMNTSNSISYSIKGIKAIQNEELGPSFLSIAPSLKLAASKFSLEGYDGQANSWKEFGKWMHNSLIASRAELPESTKLKIKALVKGVDNPIERAKIIYDFVQQKTRYISVQVGIGGWMPMLASDVDKLSYGDCKALTNYTKVLMDVANVESYYTAVYAGGQKRGMENDVVSVQGNHAFLYIPSKEKEYWLECTSQTVPFGYQGTFTDDRDVLVIKPEGGEIKHTGIHNDKDSFQNTIASYQIDASGKIEAKIKIKSGGTQYKNHFKLENKPKKEIETYYKDEYWSDINNLTIDTYSFINNKDSIIFNENVTIKATDYASFSGERLLVIINAFNRSHYIPKRYRTRKLPLEISRGFIDTDTFEVRLPNMYTIEALPNNILIENKFGMYTFSIQKISNTKLIYTRTFYIKKGFYPKSDYKSYRKFLKKIAKHDNSKIVLIKK